jgi:outer membrane protein assembly factor BamB
LLPAEQAWLRQLESLPAAGGALDRERVYIPLQEGGTVALDRESGETVWTNPVGGLLPLVLAPSAVVAINTAKVAAFDRATGATQWSVSLPSNAIGPGLSAGELLLLPLENGAVVALKTTEKGATVWSSRLGELMPPVAMAADTGNVYITTADSRVVAITLESGQQRWSATLDGTLSPPAVGTDRVFVGSTRNVFYAIDAQTGKIAWRWPSEMIGGDIVGAVVDGDVTYFVGLDNLLHAVNRGNGNQRWKQATPTRPIAPPLAFGGVVAVFGVSPTLYTFVAKTAAQVATYAIPAAAAGTAVAPRPVLVDPDLRPYRVAMVAITADGRAIGLRPTEMMFREAPTAPLTELPGKPLQRERLPTAPETR